MLGRVALWLGKGSGTRFSSLGRVVGYSDRCPAAFHDPTGFLKPSHLICDLF
jgi:hypothetical protein